MFLCDSPSATPSANTNSNERSCAGGNAAKQKRLGNTAIVTPNLLYFGVDWLTIYICYGNSLQSQFLGFLRVIFSILDDELPFAKDIQWPKTEGILFEVNFKRAKGDVFAYLKYNNRSLVSIRKITGTSTMPDSVCALYQYQITFYGEFFALGRIGELDVNEFFDVIIQEQADKKLSGIVSRLDICADIENVDVDDVWNQVDVRSPHHAKGHSPININPVTKKPQTIYYGENSDQSWFARIYDKKREIRDNKKESLYPHLFGKEHVTRVELVCKRPICKKYDVQMFRCVDFDFLLSLFKRLLQTKYVSWGIVDFVEDALKEEGVHAWYLSAIKSEKGSYTDEKLYHLLCRKVLSTAERLNQEPVHLLDEIKQELSLTNTKS